MKNHIKLILTCDPALSQWKFSLCLMRCVSREICNKPLIQLNSQKVWELNTNSYFFSCLMLKHPTPYPEIYTLILYLVRTNDSLCCRTGNLVGNMMLPNSQEAAFCSVLVRKGLSGLTYISQLCILELQISIITSGTHE